MKEIKKFIRVNKRLHDFLKENETSMAEEYQRVLRKESKLPAELRDWLTVLMSEEE